MAVVCVIYETMLDVNNLYIMEFIWRFVRTDGTEAVSLA